MEKADILRGDNRPKSEQQCRGQSLLACGFATCDYDRMLRFAPGTLKLEAIKG